MFVSPTAQLTAVALTAVAALVRVPRDKHAPMALAHLAHPTVISSLVVEQTDVVAPVAARAARLVKTGSVQPTLVRGRDGLPPLSLGPEIPLGEL